MNNLQKFKDEMSEKLFGITAKEAWDKGICVSCKEPALDKCYSKAGIKEYKASGLCEECFDEIEKGVYE